MTYPKCLEQMLAIWNSSDKNEINQLADSYLESNLHFVDPNYNIIGRQPFIDMVHAVHKKIPGAVYSHVGNFDSHNNLYRYHWAIHLQGKLIMPGFDVAEINDTGKVVKVIGFFGEFNRAGENA